ncbi:unnamed protein product [Rotaria sordida]|uniref:DNA-directed RNA polymerase subunit beta n=1 Tax=Rotaria sordida TaxID=392033 RepID=A0A814LJG8_9BILA|nr:unnamed protein product [Rotaria sordida]CAF1064446.1 unnamed protein product [Rotaria sordida]
MGKKNREHNTTRKTSSSIRQQDPTFEYLTKTFNHIDGPIQTMCDITRPHVDSFNWMLKEGLMKAASTILPLEFETNTKLRVKLKFVSLEIARPKVKVIAGANRLSHYVYPTEARMGKSTYSGTLQARIHAEIFDQNGKLIGRESYDRNLGPIPVMVRSDACNLANMNTKELCSKYEEPNENGGYFIVKGYERILRLLTMTRRNYPMAMSRGRWRQRGPGFTDRGLQIRCLSDDQRGIENTLHYLDTGAITLAFMFRKEMYFIPVVMILKMLADDNTSDREIHESLMRGSYKNNSAFDNNIKYMLRQLQKTYWCEQPLITRQSIIDYVGSHFRTRLQRPSWHTNADVARYLIDNYILIHLKNDKAKFNMLIFMIRKLFSYVRDECKAEDQDAPSMHEILLPGHVYLALLSERLETWLISLRETFLKLNKSSKTSNDASIPTKLRLAMDTIDKDQIAKAFEHFLATGNLNSKTNLGLRQTSGFSIIAERLNILRFISHFRSVHRGDAFTETKTTSVRKLLPEAWGFLCAVHTPDGSLCGLLNHLCMTCQVTQETATNTSIEALIDTLLSYGMRRTPSIDIDCYDVILDGQVVGFIDDNRASLIAAQLRYDKVTGNRRRFGVSEYIEIVLIPKETHGLYTLYPGLFIFTTPARMIRPVMNLITKTTEYIGTFEQVYLGICITHDEFILGYTTHQELEQYNFLSITANLTPFSEYNQSPRNMYQCQMGKQTMGTPSLAYRKRNDNKLYYITTPQAPLVRTRVYNQYALDDYAMGTNAIVAVLSYTGYDMEDAMVINKSSIERGFAHGAIYASEMIDLQELVTDKVDQGKHQLVFALDTKNPHWRHLDTDGLPVIGSTIQPDEVLCCYLNTLTQEYKTIRYHKKEPAHIMSVTLVGDEDGKLLKSKAWIMYRIMRTPIIGDKFSSRHGQKGVCSRLYPAEDLPFTESGLVPDIIFNPHGFPSRMTIGMLLEFMAGKSAVLHGLSHDGTPFQFNDDYPAVDYYGQLLKAAGFSYYGTESMYSGTTGLQLEVDIFIGVVYYQRLRHLVSDKFQVRTTGPVDALTNQPVKGRRREGGIRVGEMERDALLGHGVAGILLDRLLHCSDETRAYVCTRCGSLLSLVKTKIGYVCRYCCGSSTNTVQRVTIPYVLQYLIAELASVVSDKDKKQEKSSNDDENKNETRINIPLPSPPDGNWKTIQVEVLYDEEKCDLNRYDLDTVYKILESSPNGLTDDQVKERIEKFGENKIEHKERHPVIQFLLFMWNPLSWVMEVAAIVAIALSNGDGEPPDWPDFVGILLLLLINATIGYIEKYRAGNAVKALMASLAPESRVKRNNNSWTTIEASQLVPGDIIAIKLGNIVPADARIISSLGGIISIDQAALTGESLPVTKKIGDILLASTTCKQGECEAIVISTGKYTQFGRAAQMIGRSKDEMGHLQKILAKIGNFCIVSISIFIIAEIFVMYIGFRYSYRRGINNILVLLIGGLPIAMPTVLSVTLAIGAKQLSKHKAIVTRITAIEELAGVTILCSDKTGTLTLNKLLIDKETIIKYTNIENDDIIRYATYACNRENPDAIDTCVLESYGNADSINDLIIVKSFIPFDPTTKRTEVTYQDKSDSKIYRVSKGMPDAILHLCETTEQVDKVRQDVNEFANRGLRGLAVALSNGNENFKLIGLLPIFDPPRNDTAETIKKALELGVQVKMITGDQLEIAKETGRRLGMGDKMYVYENIIHDRDKSSNNEDEINKIIYDADGFASVFPEHKFEIVKRLQDMGHLVAMTGDGVNDAPALSKANVGIAVANASDAARSAAAIVLTEPGLSVIIHAVRGSRQIFVRMTSYAIYTCSITIRIIVSFALLIFIFRYDFPPFMILIMAILNDGTIMTISKDRVEPSQQPNEWRLKRIFISAIIYGLYLSASTIVFFAIIIQTNFFQSHFGVDTIIQTSDNGYGHSHLHSIIYLQVSSISQGLIFITRSHGFCFTERPTLLLIAAFIITQLCATLIAVYANWEFTDIRGCGWTWAAIIWIYNLIWFVPLDYIKFSLQAIFSRSLHVIKPFEHIHRRLIASKQAKATVLPLEIIQKTIDERREQLRQLSQREVREVKPTTFDQFTQTGSSFYSPYTDTLSALRKRDPLLRSISLT